MIQSPEYRHPILYSDIHVDDFDALSLTGGHAPGGPAWMIDLVNGDALNWDMESTSPAAVAGYPHITVPAGHIFGLPVGLSFFTGAWGEPYLIKYAFAFEQATRIRKSPQFAPSVDLTN
jgi:amidase